MLADTPIRLVGCSLAFSVLLAFDAGAEPLFRGMRIDQSTQRPVNGTAFANTQARVPQDVVTYEQNEQQWVQPLHNEKPQGLSVVTGDGCDLPANNRPKSPSTWNGSASSTMGIWTVDSAALGARLQYVSAPLPDAPNHGVIAPIEAMSLAQYQTALQTVAWVAVPAPQAADACPGADLVPHDQLEADLVAVLGAAPVDAAALDSAVLAANQGGASKAEILATLTRIGSRLDDAGDEETSNHVWDLYDRITGFCGPHACLNLQ